MANGTVGAHGVAHIGVLCETKLIGREVGKEFGALRTHSQSSLHLYDRQSYILIPIPLSISTTATHTYPFLSPSLRLPVIHTC
jgi:hypothetical protein